MTLTMSKSIAAGLRLRAAPCGMCVVRREGFVSVLCTRLLRCSMSPYLITNNIFLRCFDSFVVARRLSNTRVH